MTTIKEVAEFLGSLLNKERDKEKAAEKKAIINKISVFKKCHGTAATDIGDLVDYAIRKTDIRYEDHWYADRDSISVHYYWSSHSFFDDGGGDEGYKDWSIVFVEKEGDYLIQNEKLNDRSVYVLDAHGPTVEDSFYCKDPFGLKGIYRICFKGDWEYTD